MTISLYTFIELYDRALTTADHLLTKGVEHSAAIGQSEGEMLDWRLIDDMHPLAFQLRVVCNFARQWPARVAGLPVAEEVGDRTDVAALRADIADARGWLATLSPDQFADRDDVPLTYVIGNGMEPTLPSGRWLSVFATTNLYFHLSIAYAILRAKGTPLGKIDFFASGL